MGNRKLPFGYQMRMGEIVRNEPEAKAVQDIFLQYTLGASLKEIAEQMSKTGPTYDAVSYTHLSPPRAATIGRSSTRRTGWEPAASQRSTAGCISSPRIFQSSDSASRMKQTDAISSGLRRSG